jgi:hypothetical protein
MTYDLNDAELPRGTELIPDGTFAKVTMTIRPGGVDGPEEADRGLLKRSQVPGSDVSQVDAEFTVTAGPHARRKFWQNFVVAGGKVDEHGVSIGWKISKGVFRAMVDSALGLDPEDMSAPTQGKRMLRGLSDLSGITFAATIRIEPANDPRYGASNRLERVVLPGQAEYRRIMDVEAVQAQPTTRGSGSAPAASPAWAPSHWSSSSAASASAPAADPTTAWEQSPALAPPQSHPANLAREEPNAGAATKPTDGPSWLRD